jgi:integrase
MSDGKYPVKVCITHRRERQYYPTGKRLSAQEWQELQGTKKRVLIAVREEIQAAFKIIDDAVRTLNNEGKFTFEALNTRLGKAITDTINTAFTAKIDQLHSEGSIGNMQIYDTALHSLERYAGNRITFESITVEWLKRYETALLQQGKSYTTISIYIRCLRAIINEAKKAGIIKESQYPFGDGKYKIPIGKGRKLALTLQQIKAIAEYTDGNETTERYRDLWFFSYLCNGINFNDMLQLKYENLKNDTISWYRGKTLNTSEVKEKIEAIVTPEIANIINKYGNPDKTPSNYIFPYLTGKETPIQRKNIIKDITKRTNKRLKAIGDAVGIEHLTTYVARHSFATVLKRSGTNIAFISESLGHTSQKTTQTYLASCEHDERKKNAAKLTDWN